MIEGRVHSMHRKLLLMMVHSLVGRFRDSEPPQLLSFGALLSRMHPTPNQTTNNREQIAGRVHSMHRKLLLLMVHSLVGRFRDSEPPQLLSLGALLSRMHPTPDQTINNR